MNKINLIKLGICGMCAFLSISAFAEKEDDSGKEIIAVSGVYTVPNLLQTGEKENIAYVKFAEAVSANLCSDLINTKKYKLLAENRLDRSLITKAKDADYLSGLSDENRILIKSAKKVVVVKVFDFQNQVFSANKEKNSLLRRVVKVSATISILNVENGEQEFIKTESIDEEERGYNLREDDNALILKAAKELSQKFVKSILAWDSKLLVLNIEGNRITINGGESAEIKRGQVYKIIEQGKALKNPETGKIIAKEEFVLGTMKIISVGKDTSVGVFVVEDGISIKDAGVIVGNFVRVKPDDEK